MLIGYGLAIVLGSLPALAVAIGALVAGKKIKSHGAALAVWIVGFMAAVVVAFFTFIDTTDVWVVDEGDGGTLTARRYLLWGESGTVATLDGRPIPLAEITGPTIVANGTQGNLIVDTVHYGGFSGFTEKPEPLAPGQSRSYQNLIDGIGEPPRTIRANEKTGVVIHHYIRRP